MIKARIALKFLEGIIYSTDEKREHTNVREQDETV